MKEKEESMRKKKRDRPGIRSQAATSQTGEAVKISYTEEKRRKKNQGKM